MKQLLLAILTVWLSLSYAQAQNQNFEKYYSFPIANEELNDVTIMPSGNSYAVGSSTDTGFYIVKYNPNGAIIREKIIKPHPAFVLGALVGAFPAPNDGLYTIGNFASRNCIIHLDSQSNVTYGTILPDDITALRAVKQLSTGELVLMSYVPPANLRIDIYSPTQQSILKTKVYNQYKSPTNMVIGEGDNIFVIGAESKSIGNNTFRDSTSIIKINKTLDTAVSRIIPNNLPSTNINSLDFLAIGKNNDLYLTRQTDSLIRKLDTNLVITKTAIIPNNINNGLFFDTLANKILLSRAKFSLLQLDTALNLTVIAAYDGSPARGIIKNIKILGNDSYVCVGGVAKRKGGADALRMVIKNDNLGLLSETIAGRDEEALVILAGHAVVESNDKNGYVFTTSKITNHYQSNENIAVYKVDSAGRILWRTYIVSDSTSAFAKIVNTPNGGYAVAAYTRFTDALTGNRRDGIRFTQLDANGLIIFSKVYDNISYSVGRLGFRKHPQGGYVIGATRRSDIDTRLIPYLIRLNENGDTLFTYSFSNPRTNTTTNVFDVLVTKDNGILLAGDNYQLATNTVRNAWIGKINANKELVGNRFYDNSSSFSRFISVEEKGNELFAGGRRSTDRKAMVYRLNGTTLDSMSSVYYTNSANLAGHESNAIVVEKATGNILSFNAVPLTITEIDPATMSIIQDSTYGTPTNNDFLPYFFYGGIATTNNGIAGIGAHRSFIYLLSKDNNQTKVFNIQPIPFDITLYPNPIQQGREISLNIQEKNKINSRYDAVVYNSMGQAVLTQPNINLNATISTQGLGKGTYFIRINNEAKQAIALPFLIVE